MRASATIGAANGDQWIRARARLWIVPLVVGLPGVAGYFLLAPHIQNVVYAARPGTTVAVLVGVAVHRPARPSLWILPAMRFF